MLSYCDYWDLYEAVFNSGHSGYRPEIVESPNGDGKLDFEKRYAHVALKYKHRHPRINRELDGYFMEGYRLALQVAKALNVPEYYMPDAAACALRVLEYKPGAASHVHTDFNLFTLMLYRDQPNKFVSHGEMPANVKALNEQCHLGELAECIGMGRAHPHEVLPSDTAQHSVVFFALPRHEAFLPSWGGPDMTVGSYIAERSARSRSY